MPDSAMPRLVLGVVCAAAVSLSATQGTNGTQSFTLPQGLAPDVQGIRELSGRVEVTSFQQWSNPQSLQSICENRRFAEETALHYHNVRVEMTRPPDRNLTGYLSALHDLAEVYSYSGRMSDASRLLTIARDTAAASHLGDARSRTATFDALIGISELRRGELENCVMHPNADRCIFPVSRAGQHEMTSGAEAALAALSRAHAGLPDDLEIRWLLNVTAMTLGRYPEGVPAAALIPKDRFASPEDPGRFVDIAAEIGLNRVDRAGGLVLDDFNGDGRLDVAMSSVDPCEPLHLYLQADGHFRDSTHAGLDDQLGGINMVQADYDNDGRLDLFVMRGGWEGPIRNSLLHNNGDGTFTDVTKAAGLLESPSSTHSAAWADYDNDGYLDLMIGHERTPSRLFHNRGNGMFEDVTRRAGIEVTAITKGVAWGDYDGDGYPDLYLSNFGSPNVLYHNSGNGTFTDVTAKMGVAGPILSFPTWFFDYDNDGWPDLFVGDFVPSVAEMAKAYLGIPPKAETLRLYHNIHGERFKDVTRQMGLDRVTMTMGANYGDIDNDGWLDIYLGTGAPSFAALSPNLLFRNHDGERFVDVTTASGTGHLQKGHGVGFGDLDGDGAEDIVVNIGGFVPADAYSRAVFHNPGHPGHWITLQLEGVRTNRAALGVPVTIVARMPDGTERRIYRVVSSGGSYGSSPLAMHVGVGSAESVPEVQISWPVSRKKQIIRDLPLDRATHIVEPRQDSTQ